MSLNMESLSVGVVRRIVAGHVISQPPYHSCFLYTPTLPCCKILKKGLQIKLYSIIKQRCLLIKKSKLLKNCTNIYFTLTTCHVQV
ncbi:hypothetical protein L6452_13586 [Arctium lappa]|uniref:Uncharacterized protein n=1 Tax=Arctium lappa TaxID=4217 RepID=A0ACB9CII4_ARCLA|nr:hypothetical protein L6452_13586 [Arctium lappa]